MSVTHIKQIIIAINASNLDYLKESLINYNSYLKKALEFDWPTEFKLSKGAIKRRIKDTQKLIDDLELGV